MPSRIAPTLRWTQRVNGLCGQTCRNGPRHMYSAAFEDTYLLSWMTVDESDTWRQFGNVSTFNVSADGQFSKVSDTSFDGKCSAIYGMASNHDGSVIAVLCEGLIGSALLPGAVNLLETERQANCTEDWEGRCYPIGQYSGSDAPLYIFEYKTGMISDTPDRIVLVNHAVGGWRYGHHELSLNAAEDTYFVSLKVTAGPTADNRHEGLKHFGVKRVPDWSYVRVTDEWGCGPGHVLANRLAYNRANDAWAKLCTLDSCNLNKQYENGQCESVTWSTVPGVTKKQTIKYEGEELLSLEHPGQSWTLSGGGHGILSLGADGWLALASGPGFVSANPKPETIGLIRLPPSVPELRTEGVEENVPVYGDGASQTGNLTRYQWDWLSLPAPKADREKLTRAGFGNMAYFDTQGEDSERLLVGWSPSVETQGITSEYVVSEMDRQGRLRGKPVTLTGTGWGEDNLWATMPNSGCVVFPFAWVGENGPGQSYPIEGSMDASVYPSTMHMTSLCPATSSPPPLLETDGRTDEERWPSSHASSAQGCGCTLVGRHSATSGIAAWLGLCILGLRRRTAKNRRGASCIARTKIRARR